jgi:hypothetical protein
VRMVTQVELLLTTLFSYAGHSRSVLWYLITITNIMSDIYGLDNPSFCILDVCALGERAGPHAIHCYVNPGTVLAYFPSTSWSVGVERL